MKWVIGIDEVGRGPLAGPVYVCAVAMLEKDYKKAVWPGLTDSKKMTSRAREAWYLEAQPLSFAGKIGFVVARRTAKDIDKRGIAVCIRECITECLKNLEVEPLSARVLLDGSLKAPAEYKNQQTIIKGDLKEKIISLASVIAKVERDHYMIMLHKKHPHYDWSSNKGYGTLAHRKAIKKWGVTPFHRKSYLSKINATIPTAMRYQPK